MKTLVRIFIPFFFLCLTANVLAQTFTGQRSLVSDIDLPQITEFDLYQINVQAVQSFINSSEFDQHIHLKLGADYDWSLSLYKKDLFAANFEAYQVRSNGKNAVKQTATKAYTGFLPDGSEVRFSFIEDYFIALIRQGDEELFMEPLFLMQPDANKDLYVVYNTKNVVVNPNHTCGVTEQKKLSKKIGNDLKRLDTYTGTTTCRKIEMATCADRSMFDSYGTIAATNSYIAGIINLVEMDYQNPSAFIYDLQFEIVEQVVITGNNPAAWSSNYENNGTRINTGALRDFCGWASTGFSATYDLAQLWTAANLFATGADGTDNFNPVGVANIYGFCSDNMNCSLIEDFSNNAATMQQTVSHELGHNFGCPHNNPAGNNIMEPFVNPAASIFSETSQLFGNASLVDCPGPSTCQCLEIVEVIPINCDPETGVYSLQVTVEHNGNTGLFALSAGGIFANFNYGGNIQTAILPFVPIGTNSISAFDLADATCSDEVNYIEPGGVTSLRLGYCEGDDTDYELMGTVEEFGSIRLTLLSDGYASQENAAIIYDVNGAVVYDYFVSSFSTNGTTTRNTGLLNLAYAPYKVVVGDIFGDGLQANTCFGAPELEGGYLVQDGAGNVIYGPTTPPYGPLVAANCDGNEGFTQVHTFTPAVQATFGGNFSGTSVIDNTADDGLATFNPATAGVGQHFIDYTFDSYYIRPNSQPFQNAREFMGQYCERITVNVYSVPQIELFTSVCNDDGTYSVVVVVDLGAWNVVTSGVASGMSISTNVGDPIVDMTPGGNVIISNIPIGTDLTVVIGDDTDNVCTQSLTIPTPPECQSSDCEANSGDW